MVQNLRTRPFPATGALLVAALCWGVSTALSKIAIAELAPTDLFAVEVSTGAVCLGIAALVRGARPRRPSGPVVLLGVLEPGLAFLLFDIGIAHTAATDGALLLSTDSLFTAGLAAAFLGERLGPRLRLALAAGVAGSLLVSLNGGGGMGSLLGDGLVLAASLSAAGYGVLARRVAPGRDTLSLTAVQMLVAAAIALAAAAGSFAGHHSHIADADAGHLAAALAVGILASVVPFVLYNAAIARVTATAAGLTLTLVPLFGTLASLLLLGEPLGGIQLAGGACVIAAAALAATGGEPDGGLA
jgi:drug/metabolite transporter (DMT)-like permease